VVILTSLENVANRFREQRRLGVRVVTIPKLHLLDDDDEREEAHSLGIRTLRQSGGSVVVTIPPSVLSGVDMECGDDVAVHASSDSITLTKLPDRDDA